eukprot:COSAG06_NODE_62_length_27058_cov_17.867725_28_plen_183_part_00
MYPSTNKYFGRDRKSKAQGRTGAACLGGCSWCWQLVGQVSGAYPPTCVLRRPPPLLAAALRALFVVAGSAAATVATDWSRPSQCTRAALLILPRAADRRWSGRVWWRQAAQAWWIRAGRKDGCTRPRRSPPSPLPRRNRKGDGQRGGRCMGGVAEVECRTRRRMAERGRARMGWGAFLVWSA